MSPRLPSVFVDSGVLVGGLIRPLSPPGVLMGWACLRVSPYRIVVADYVRMEVERALVRHRSELVEILHEALRLMNALPVRLPTAQEVAEMSGIIRHRHDEPVLASAMIANPAVIVSDNSADFTPDVAQRVGIPIETSAAFMARLARHAWHAPQGPES